MKNDTLEFLRFHWADAYEIEVKGDRYVAIARFGRHETLAADDAGNLLKLIRRPYPGPMADMSDL